MTFMENHRQAIDAESSGDTSSTKDSYYAKPLSPRQLQRPCEWCWKEQDSQVADYTDDSIRRDDGVLVEALVHLCMPVCADGLADEDLDEQPRDVVGD